MTFKEKITIENPDKVDDSYLGGVEGCPHYFGYETYEDRPCKIRFCGCDYCWNREIPEENIEKGGKSMATTRKTKAELMEEIEAKNAEIKDLKKEMAALERYKQYDEAANELKVMHDSFINSGFSRTEATTLLLTLINKFTA